MKRILVPVDFSEKTESACLYALSMVSGRSEIHLFYVYYDQVVVTDGSFPTGVETESLISEQLLHDIRLRAKKDLNELKTKLKKRISTENKKGINIIVSMEGGEPGQGITRLAEDYLPDLIVMGTSAGHRKGFLEGSISKKIMNNAFVPVIAVPELAQLALPHEVMYATELSDDDASVIRKIFRLLRAHNPRIFCLHVLRNEKYEDVKARMDRLRSEFIEDEFSGRIQFFIIEETDLRQDIEKFIHQHDISLLSFIPHKRSFIRSVFTQKVTKKDLFQFHLPLLAIQ